MTNWGLLDSLSHSLSHLVPNMSQTSPRKAKLADFVKWRIPINWSKKTKRDQFKMLNRDTLAQSNHTSTSLDEIYSLIGGTTGTFVSFWSSYCSWELSQILLKWLIFGWLMWAASGEESQISSIRNIRHQKYWVSEILGISNVRYQKYQVLKVKFHLKSIIIYLNDARSFLFIRINHR